MKTQRFSRDLGGEIAVLTGFLEGFLLPFVFLFYSGRITS